jgi:hypothetical protein
MPKLNKTILKPRLLVRKDKQIKIEKSVKLEEAVPWASANT